MVGLPVCGMFNVCVQIFRNVIVPGGCKDTVRESALKVDCERKYYMAVFKSRKLL